MLRLLKKKGKRRKKRTKKDAFIGSRDLVVGESRGVRARFHCLFLVGASDPENQETVTRLKQVGYVVRCICLLLRSTLRFRLQVQMSLVLHFVIVFLFCMTILLLGTDKN